MLTALRELFSTAFLTSDFARYELLVGGYLMPEAERCVQCGICSYNCPMGIDVRAHAWRGLPIRDSRCLACGECVARCPRGVLRFERPSRAAGTGEAAWQPVT